MPRAPRRSSPQYPPSRASTWYFPSRSARATAAAKSGWSSRNAKDRLATPAAEPGDPLGEEARSEHGLGAPAGVVIEPGERDTERHRVQRHARAARIARRFHGFRATPPRGDDQGQDGQEREAEADSAWRGPAIAGRGGAGTDGHGGRSRRYGTTAAGPGPAVAIS